jgi:DNA polymerase III subunit gamma/tau
MSYQVIARKWRPPTFKELIGQDHVSQTLLNALRIERLPHALLFTGPRGVGKTSSARILAKSLKCPKAKSFVPCNSCSVCEEIAVGSSLDVLEIDGASHNGVEAIRELRETVGYMPSSGKYKIYIIDEVHMLSTSAFNALLKTLEEPPAHVIFIFATTEPQKIPVTILSRCQRFDFRRIPTRMIMDHLQVICEKENVKAEQEALWVIARQSDGSSRDSQSLLDQIITFSDGKITLQKAIEVLGLTDRALLLDTLQGLVERSPEKIMQVVERLYFAGCDPKVFLQELIEEIRHLLIVKMSGTEKPTVVDLPDSEIDHLRGLAKGLTEEDIHLLFDMSLKGSQDFLRAQDPRLALEMLLLRMSHAPRIESLFQWKAGAGPNPKSTNRTETETATETSTGSQGPVGSVRATEPQAPAAPEVKAGSVATRMNLSPQFGTTAPKAKAQTPAEELTDRWAQFVKQLRSRSPTLAAKLDHVAPLEIKGNELTIGVAREKKFLCEQLNEAKTIKDIEGHLQALWGKPMTLTCQILDGTPAVSPFELGQKKQQEQQNTIKKEVESHPLIQKAQKTFKAQIKSIKENQ